MAKKRVLNEITLTKIATVDVPCQEHALAAIIKNKDSGDEPVKPDNEGVHMSVLKKALGLPDAATDAEVEAAVAKMAADLKAANEQTAAHAEVVKAKDAEIAKAKAEVAAAEIAKAAAEGDESFTKFDGAIIKKSAVGLEMFSMLKAANDEVVKARLSAETSELSKRAQSEFGNIPDADGELISVLRLAKRAPEAEGKALEDILKAHNDLLAQGMVRNGISKGKDVEEGDPDDKLDVMAKARAKQDNISVEAALLKVLETPEGASLYNSVYAQ